MSLLSHVVRRLMLCCGVVSRCGAVWWCVASRCVVSRCAILSFVLSATAEESAAGEVGAGETTVGAVEAVREVAGQKGTDIHAAGAERGNYTMYPR